MKLAVFDFCGTLVSFQTADEFVRYVIKKSDNKCLPRRYACYKIKKRIGLYKIKNKLLSNGNVIYQKMDLLYILRGLNRETIEYEAKMYYHEMILPRKIVEVNNLMLSLKDDGYQMIVVSAGYSPYIKLFCRDVGIPYITNEFKYKGDIFTGKLQEKDCYGYEKVNRLKAFFDLNKFEYIVNVSDSFSDMPLFDLSNRKIFVTDKKNTNVKGMEVLCWESKGK